MSTDAVTPLRADCLAHWQESFAGITVETRLEVVGEPDAPGRTGRDLFASDDAVIDETMNGRGCDAERGRHTFGQQFACGGICLWDEATGHHTTRFIKNVQTFINRGGL
jgi:hypothetical protein